MLTHDGRLHGDVAAAHDTCSARRHPSQRRCSACMETTRQRVDMCTWPSGRRLRTVWRPWQQRQRQPRRAGSRGGSARRAGHAARADSEQRRAHMLQCAALFFAMGLDANKDSKSRSAAATADATTAGAAIVTPPADRMHSAKDAADRPAGHA
mmetsp:Transcript_34059/g.101305  ORF Transcript_34059/g.101305 Transcript_34059/m.101305 type:complete len:153 (-) Transcript_34059:80-538(-)